ncbi:MAG: hypothetical protein JW844_04620 [Candidatus Omnitrophica bacterium]|nr:hypothetical protein [Candidatus Omnitrophota bacterium]
MPHHKHIIAGITGSVAACRAPDIIGRLAGPTHTIRCVCTASALHFIEIGCLEALTGQKVYVNLFSGTDEPRNPQHITLADSDLVLVAPATANIIGKVACGIADDLLSSVIMATKAPVIFAPAMNEKMYTNPIVQSNITRLEKLGYQFIGPVRGRLACGTEGMGHIASTDAIVAAAEKALT